MDGYDTRTHNITTWIREKDTLFTHVDTHMDSGEETITYPCRYTNKTNYLSLLIWWWEELLLTHVDTGEETIAYTC